MPSSCCLAEKLCRRFYPGDAFPVLEAVRPISVNKVTEDDSMQAAMIKYGNLEYPTPRTLPQSEWQK